MRGYKKRYISIIGSLLLMLILGFWLFVKYRSNSFPSEMHTLPSLSQETKQSIIVNQDILQIDLSELPRKKIVTYTVKKDDTLSSVSKTFRISVDTIKWANEIKSDTLKQGQNLVILPVTGVTHKVIAGDTVDTLAVKYHTDEKKIIDYPFNQFANPRTYSLIIGSTIIIPDGRFL